MFSYTNLSRENQCAIQESFSTNTNWPYEWFCTFEVGDLAEGGIVFYVDESGQHGLVAAMEDLGEYEWGCFGTELSGADGTSIGTGYQNTLDIVSGCSETPIAASEALAFMSDGYDDWYLPSENELLQIYNSIDGLSGVYWSSSEYNYIGAFVVNWYNAASPSFSKNNSYNVRVIRAF